MKRNLQKMVMGLLMASLLFGSVTVFAANTRTIEVTSGNVRTTLFGQEFVVRDADGAIIEPFIYNGIAYVPVNAVVHAMGVNAQWNEATQTLNFGAIGTAQPPTNISKRTSVYLEDGINSVDRSGIARFPANGSFSMGETTFFRGITSSMGIFGSTRSATYDISSYNFIRLTGTFGRVGNASSGTITITGDGSLLGGFEIGRNDIPIIIDVEIPTGIQRIDIRFSGYNLGFGNARFY